MGRNERRRADGQVKTHLSLRAGRLFRVRCNTGEKKADLVRHQCHLHGFNIFGGGSRYLRHAKRLLRQRENVDIFGRIIRLAFVRSNFNSYNR